MSGHVIWAGMDTAAGSTPRAAYLRMDYSGGRQSGRTLRHLAHLLDLAREGQRILYVVGTRAETVRLWDTLTDLVPEATAQHRYGHRLAFPASGGFLLIKSLAVEPDRVMLGHSVTAVVFDHAAAQADHGRFALWHKMAKEWGKL